MKIDVDKYLKMQPGREACAADEFYVRLAARLGKIWDAAPMLSDLPHNLRHDILMAVIGYFQDIVADAGIWRSFISLHHKKFGCWLPYYEIGNEYVEFELNEADIRFLIWYVIEGNTATKGSFSPLHKGIELLAKIFFAALDEVYLEAPTPASYGFALDIELHSEEDAQLVYELSHWLYWDSYLMRHSLPFDGEPPVDADYRDSVMASQPVGPIPLPIADWLELIVNNKFPS